MDKLDKLPPKDIKPLKDNPIAQGIISNAVYSGVSALIALVIRHYALIAGIPPWLALFLGVVAFFLLSISFYVRERRKQAKLVSAAASADLTGESESETIERIGNKNDQLQGELHLAEREIATLTGDKAKLERQLVTIKKDKHTLEQSLETSRRELSEANEKTEDWTRKYWQEHNDAIPIKRLNENYEGQLAENNKTIEGLRAEIASLRDDAKNANQRAHNAEVQNENWARLTTEAERKVHELQWMVDILKPQESALQDHVVITSSVKIRVDLIDTRLGPPRIRFGFKIRNEALPNVTIHERGVGGKVYFRDHPLTETCRFDPTFASSVNNLKHKADGWLFLDQKFTESEIDRINKALVNAPNAEFSFEHVIIKVSGGDNFPYEATEPLHIPGDCQRVKLKDCQLNSNTENH